LQSWQEYLRFVVTLTAVLDPFLAVPIFVSATTGYRARERQRLARVVTVTVFLVLTGAALFGDGVLRIMGASLPAFQVGGGLVLLLMSLAMLNAHVGDIRQTRAEAKEMKEREYTGVVPLAVPLLAGPGAIGTSIIAAQNGGVLHQVVLVACIALLCALVWLVLHLAQSIASRLGTTGLNIASRLLGLLLAAIAIQTMAEGLRVLFPGLG
jgi:multiple antibiotic resistance protein